MIASATNNGTHAVRWVYLDGVAMKNILYANDETGEVTYNPVDEKGNLVMVGKVFAEETKTGHVVIELNVGWRYNTVTKSFALLPKHLLH